MAIAFDASSESHTGTTGSTSQASFSWTHTPVGTPKGVLVFTFTVAELDILDGDNATSVTYGGVNLTAVTGGRAEYIQTQSSNEGDCKAWFLGSSVPTGSQTVVVNRTNNSLKMYAVAITVTSSQNSATHDAGIVLLQDTGTISSQSVTDGSSGTGNSLRFAGINCENSSFGTVLPSTPAFDTLYPDSSNSTWLQGIDFGSIVCGTVRETTAGTGSRSVGFIGATAYRAAVHLAVKDVAGGATTVVKDLINGFGIMPFKR